MVGIFNTLVGFALFAAAYLLFGDQIGYMGSLVVAYAIAMVMAFQLHRRFVFTHSGSWFRGLAKFTAVHLTSLGSNALLLPLLVEVAGLDALLAQAMAMGLSVVFSFFAHKHFTFRDPVDLDTVAKQ